MQCIKILTFSLCLTAFFLAPIQSQAHEIISNKANGEAGYAAYHPNISNDGNWVAFSSLGKLLPTDQNAWYDIYLRNLVTGEILHASTPESENQSNGNCQYPVLSAKGRFVAFNSSASNLVRNDNNNTADIFVHDRQSGVTEIISIATDGTQGTYSSNRASISADGRYVAFHTASQLSSNDTSSDMGIYLRDRQEQTTTFIAHGSWPALSDDGSAIAYHAFNNLVLYDIQNGTTETIATNTYSRSRFSSNPFAYIPSISAEGRFVVYEGWSADNAPLSTEVFLYDRLNKRSQQISQRYDGSPLSAATGPYNMPLKPQISDNGRFIVFLSSATDIVEGEYGNHLFIHNVENKTTECLGLENLWESSLFPIFSISGGGETVVFQDSAYNHFPQQQYLHYGYGIFAVEHNIETLGDISIKVAPDVLWPPNSKITDVEITVEATGATDFKIEVLDEYNSFSQIAYGNTAIIPLEAWRKGNDKDGRNYCIKAIAIGASGEQKSVTTRVVVPHDKRLCYKMRSSLLFRDKM